jgi:hypothetical protein
VHSYFLEQRSEVDHIKIFFGGYSDRVGFGFLFFIFFPTNLPRKGFVVVTSCCLVGGTISESYV